MRTFPNASDATTAVGGRTLLGCLLGATLSCLLSPSGAWATVQVINLRGHMAWRVAAGDLDGGGTTSIVAGTYDGHLLRVETASGGSIAWDYATPSGAAISDVAVGNFNHDGQQQIVAASADGSIYALSPNGALLWRYEMQGGVALQAKFAHLQGPAGPATVAAISASHDLVLLSTSGVKLKSIRLDTYPAYLRAGNFLGDGKDKIFVMATTSGEGAFSLHLYGDSLALLSRLSQGRYEPFASNRSGFDCVAAAVSGLGRDEVVTPYGTAAYGATPRWAPR